MRYVVIILAVILSNSIFGQENSLSKNDTTEIDSKYDTTAIDFTVSSSRYDSLVSKERAAQELKSLKTGTLVVRLKTNDKSVKGYAEAGKQNIADRIIEDRKIQNTAIIRAFKSYYTFSKVLFIYARDTKRFLKGEKGVFLNDALTYDPSIVMKDTFFIIAEYGAAIGASIQENRYWKGGGKRGSYISSEANTISNSALVLSNRNLEQLNRPFPFCEAVYLNNYDGAVIRLNNALEGAYARLVFKKELHDVDDKQKKKK